MKIARGQVAVEYLILVALVAVVVVNGNLSPLERSFDAFKAAYQRFTLALSLL